jgi:tetratricopeptide (TPR) repeat protein
MYELRKHTLQNITRVNLFLIGLFIAGCSNSGDQKEQLLPFPYANTDRSVRYVGSEKCKQCHEEIYQSYMQSEMGRSMYPVSGMPAIEQFPSPIIRDEQLNFSYQAFTRDGKLYQREFRTHADGSIAHERTVEARYVMGSGNNLRMYFYEEGGMLYQLPLTWYVHKRAFDLSPGYKDFGNVRFSRFTSAKCLSCHNAYLTPERTSVDRYQTPFDLGIGCERCHGPGELHLKEANGDEIAGLKEGAKTIIDPRTLPHEQQMDVCRQCHLQGKAWVLTKNDGDYFDFRPGELLSAHRSVYFKAQTRQEVVEVGDSPQRLSMSRCYQESGNSLTCITCHDPHFSVKTFSAGEYNRKCMQCHPQEKLRTQSFTVPHTQNANCISCHMNRTGNNNTLHGVSNTDHWIRVNATATKIDWRSLRTPTLQPIAQLAAFLDNRDSLSNERLAEAYLYYYLEHDPRAAYLDSALTYLQPYQINGTATSRSYSILAQIRSRRGEHSEAAAAYRQAITMQPENSELQYQLGTTLVALGNFREAADAFSAASHLKPDEPKYLESLGIANYRQSDFAAARESFEKAIAKDSQNGQIFFFLGNIHALGNRDAATAVRYYRTAVTLTPDLPNAHLNLGNAYLLLQQADSAMVQYRLELQRDPRSVSALVNLGRTYDMKGDRMTAKSYYKKAVQVDPTSAVARDLLYQ